MTRTAGAQIGCQRPSRFWGLGCPKIYHEVEDTLVIMRNRCSTRARTRDCWRFRLRCLLLRFPRFGLRLS
ncbi:hypothetical protein, partial [Thiolapillus sp.]|uniref:hypothetical protein n=1 Tax=Thiolapillus sp. TaxID=2017437 RepID=UPI003AF849A8